jgi:hypothetical protein
MIRTSLAALVLAAAFAAPAMAADSSPADVVARHMQNAGKNDVAAVLADYADDAVVLTSQGQATQGKAAIGAMFKTILAPGGAASNIKTTKVWSDGDVGFVSWEAGLVKGVDMFVVRHGKIEVQSVFIGGGAPAGR